MKTPVQAPQSPVVEQAAPAVRSVTIVHSVPTPTSQIRASVMVLTALVLLGCILRFAALLMDRCLWIDEAMLALNLVSRTPQQLFKPLDYNQGAPVGFLLAVKATISLFGSADWSLRLIPFAASVAGLCCFAWLARRLFTPPAAILAVTLFAMSPHMVSYASECKQYASDAAIAIGLFATAIGLLEGKNKFSQWLVLAVAGAIAVWCSHPAAFVLGGIGTALLLNAVIGATTKPGFAGDWSRVPTERDRARFCAAALTVACWLASFAACYFLCLKQLSGNTYLTNYWVNHFLSLPPTGIGDLSWIADHLIAFFEVPGGFGGTLIPLAGFAAVLALIGLREFARERWPVAVALVVPLVLVLFASGLRKYPFGGRLLLFLVPFAVLLVAHGAWTLYEAVRERNRFAAVAILGLLVGASAWQTLDIIRRPPRQEQLAPVLEDLRTEMQPGDRVYVYYSAVPAFKFYTRERPLPAETITLGQDHRDNLAGYRDELSKLHGRVWVIFAHPHDEEETLFRTTLDFFGTFERKLNRPGAAVWLYRLD